MKTTGAGGEGDGREREPRSERASKSDDNVVRLPRDWLGPRDELVPFGPSADVHLPPPVGGKSTSTPRAPAFEGEAGGPSPVPVSPADFWGEHAAALHEALEERDEAFAKRVASRARAVVPFAWLRRPALVAGLAAALALVVVGYVSLVGQTGNRARSRPNLSQRGVTSPWAFLPRLSRSHAVGSSGRSGRPVHRATGTHAIAVSYSSHRSTPGTSSQSASSLSALSTTPAAPVAPTSSTSSASTTADVGAGSKAPAPAFGAHGALGPGRSRTR